MECYVTVTLLTLFASLTIGLFLRWYRKISQYWKVRGIPHEPMSVITHIQRIMLVPLHELSSEQQKKHGRIYGSFELHNPLLTVSEPDLLRDILVKNFHVFPYRRRFNAGDDLMGKMIILLEGDDWKRVRTVITPAFTSRKMRQMSHIINECSKTAVDNFGKYSEKGEPVDCKAIFGAFTVDVIARSAFGTKIDSHNDPENIFVKHAKQAFSEPPMWRMVLIILTMTILPTWFVKLIKLSFLPSADFFKNVVLQVVKERRETGKRYEDILQLFLDAQDEVENENFKGAAGSDAQGDDVDRYGSVETNGITLPKLKYKKLHEDELVAQCILFYIVGYETTASTLSFMAYALALNPECQEKLIKEVDEVFETHEEINYDVVRGMKYLDCVVSETLRMYPSLVRSERTATEDYKLGNTGLTIEKGTLIGFNIYAMHYDPEFFPNPEKFDPERFMSENASHPQYAYLPFGAGPRNCLGMRFALMELKICMTNVLRHYRFKRTETTKVPLQYSKRVNFLSVKHLPLIAERRNK